MRDRLRFGEGSIHELTSALQSLDIEKLMLVVDRPAYSASGAQPIVDRMLPNYDVRVYADFAWNPKVEDVERGVRLFCEFRPQALVAIGGGSAIDMAKLIGFCGRQNTPAKACVLGRLDHPADGSPLIAIPTTAGTGSEATHFAVVYVDKKKYSLAHDSMLPVVAIVDPVLTYSLPAQVTAATGLDALCQAIESIWAVDATDQSMNWAIEALTLANQHLEEAVNRPSPIARRAMSRAAYLAGQAINVTRTTAPHALSYALTTHFQVPHGIAVALTLADFLAFNSQVDTQTCTDSRGPSAVRQRIDRIVEILGGDVAGSQQRLWKIAENIGCPTRLGQVGVREDDLYWLASEVNLQRLANNPRVIDTRSLQQILQARF